jgi:hypothetical protein
MRAKISLMVVVLALAGVAAHAAASDPPLTIGGVWENGLIGLAGTDRADLAALSTLRLRADLPLAEGIVAKAEGTLFGVAVSDTVVDTVAAILPELARDPSRRFGGALDRLYVRADRGPVQVTAGRQRISWGGGTAFAPSDYFNPPNPLDPEGPKAGVDGLTVRYSLGPLAYVAVAGAHVERYVTEGLSSAKKAGDSAGVRAGTHIGTTDVAASYGYDAPAREEVTAVEAKGDLGVGWHGALVRRVADSGEAGTAGMAGIDYSFASGQWITNLEYQYEEGAVGQADQDQWYAGVTYVPDETSSLSANAVYYPASDAKTLVANYARQLTSNLDLNLRAIVPIGEASPIFGNGVIQSKVAYSF